ncbi:MULTISPECIES: hypothetical protein [Paenibacillus]|uniref:hypothetical protein n=1 Tax=Paenibacillus TaxID=44249 RepID=UPI0022B86B4E|nr:hypothetical protein [Paenibacillus caseinilyticus]MCZ8522235.1 hypothetical protein [Paenibacillus caseinilyticus]
MTEDNQSKEAQAAALFGMNPEAGYAAQGSADESYANSEAPGDQSSGQESQSGMMEAFAGAQQNEGGESDEAGEGTSHWFQIMQNAALAGRASFPDQIDYYDPENDEFV